MAKKDFSLRIEIEETLNKLNISMTEEQIDRVVDEVTEYESFLSIVTRYVVRGIEEVATEDGVSYDKEKIEEQMRLNGEGVNYEEI